MRLRVLALLAIAGMSGCANPLNGVTADRYNDECGAAERAGDMKAAEQLCYRSLVNVEVGALGPEVKSERLYNLGRIKRRVAKFSEAEELLKQSLAVEDSLPSPSPDRVGRRIAELSVALAAQDKWAEGLGQVERLLPLAEIYSGRERAYVVEIFRKYAPRAASAGNAGLAAALEAKVRALEP